MLLELRAAEFAKRRHGGQVRKYTGEEYFSHLRSVAEHLRKLRYPPWVVAAGYLHDLLEDTNTTSEELSLEFGGFISDLVWQVTDRSKPGDGNRKARKEIDREHLRSASTYGKAIKLADLIDNTKSIVTQDPKFAKVYLQEKGELLKVLCRGGNPALEAEAKTSLEEAWKLLREKSIAPSASSDSLSSSSPRTAQEPTG